MATFTPTRNPRGGGHYDAEEDLPYKQAPGADGDGSAGGKPYRPGGAGRTSSRDAKPSSRHRRRSGEDLAGAEAAAGGGGVDSSEGPEVDEKDALDDATGNDSDDGSLYNDDKRGIRNWSRRKKAAGGLGAVFGFGVIGIFMMGIGPFQFIQLAQSLQNFHFGNNESMMDGRASRIVYYGRNSRERGNLGLIGNRVADSYEAKLRAAGLEADYRNPDTGRSTRSIQSFTINTNTPEGQQAVINLRNSGVDVPLAGADGKITIRLRGEGSQKLSRKVIRASLSSIGINSVSSWMGGRLLIRRADVKYSWLKKLVVEGSEDLTDAWRARNLEAEADIDNGSQSIDPSRRPSDAPDVDGDDDIVVAGDPDATASHLDDAIRGGVGVIGLVALVCAVDKFGDGIAQIQQSNIVLPLIRTGAFAISMGSQVMSNQGFNAEDLGAFSMRLFDPETGLGWSAAKSIQAEWGVENPSGPDIPKSAKPGKAKPLFFEQLDGVIGAVPGLEDACNFLTSPAGGAAVDIADFILAIIEGPGAVLVEIVGQGAGVAAGPFIQDLARWLAGEPLQEFAQGALFGNYANYGARLMANDEAVSTGGVELTGTQTAQLDADRLQMEKTELQHKSVFARLLDPYEPGSLVARTVLQNPNLASPEAASTHFAQLPTTVFRQISSSFANIFSPKLQAINSSGYDYGFPEYGYALDLQDDTRFDDPYENGEIVETLGLDHGAELNETYGIPCFGTTISESGVLTTMDSRPMAEIPEICKGNNDDLVRYRFYIADTIAMKSMACLDNIDEAACGELGFGSGTAAGGGGGSLPDGDATSLAQIILDNANIGKDPEPLGILQSMAAGNGPCPSVNGGAYTLDTELLRVIAALGQNNSFTITSLHRGCTGSTVGAGTASRHWRGKAADVSGSRPINGVVQGEDFSNYNPVIQTFINEAAGYLPAGCELGVPNDRYANGARSTSPACTNIFLDTPENTGATGPHVHLGVP